MTPAPGRDIIEIRPRNFPGLQERRAKMKQVPLEERMQRWCTYNRVIGNKLTRILIHPNDFPKAPETFEGLPVVCMQVGL